MGDERERPDEGARRRDPEGRQQDLDARPGDLEELDVEGARHAGLHSALYAPDADGRAVHTEAEFVVTDWRDFAPEVQRRFTSDVN